LRNKSLRNAIENSHVNSVILNVSGVIIIVTLSLAKIFVRVPVAGSFPVLKVLVFAAVGVLDKVAPVSKSQDEDGPMSF